MTGAPSEVEHDRYPQHPLQPAPQTRALPLLPIGVTHADGTAEGRLAGLQLGAHRDGLELDLEAREVRTVAGLGVCAERCFYQCADETLGPTRLRGYDDAERLGHFQDSVARERLGTHFELAQRLGGLTTCESEAHHGLENRVTRVLVAAICRLTMRWLTFLLLSSLVACATLLGPSTKTGKPKAAAEGEETGVTNISRLLREFNQALNAKQFDAATALLIKAEKAERDASDVTRSHPDFEDVTEEVKTARTQLDTAIELDRIARRNAAIDDSIHKGELLMNQGSAMLQELKARYPTDEDFQSLKETIANLARLRADGRQYEDEERYRQHAALLDPKLAALDLRRRQAEWQHKAATAAGDAIEQAYEAAQGVHEAANIHESIAAFQKASAGFVACVNTLNDLAHDPEYEDDRLIETRLGVLGIADTKRLCTERAGKARQEADWRDWQDKVITTIAAVGPAVQHARGSKRASEALPATQEAVAALRKCQASLDGIAKHPGARDSQTFQSMLGNVTVSGLRQACASEEVRYAKMQPSLKWAAGLDEVVVRLEETKTRMDQADAIKAPEKRVEAWRTVVGGFKECADQSRKVGADPAAVRSLALNTPFGKLTVSALEKECARLVGVAETNVQAATDAAELQKFVTTCKGDETAVANREGIPTRVEPVHGGRVFFYEKAGKGKTPTVTSFGFDTNGKRVDFRVRWLEELSSLVGELNRLEDAIRIAPSGRAALKATEALMPVLSGCTETLDNTEKLPGYDASAVFTTGLGKVTAPKLREACTVEKSKRATTLVPLGWRIRLEELRDRVVEAQSEMERAKAAGDSKTRLDKLSASVGGFTECVERADTLAGEPGADKILKVRMGKADINLAGLKKSCETDLAMSRKEADKAAAQKELEDFIATCKSDEAEVARREGLPTRVDKRANGRLFIYEGRGKGKAKRFAFNVDGHRVEEKALGAVTPELESIPKK